MTSQCVAIHLRRRNSQHPQEAAEIVHSELGLGLSQQRIQRLSRNPGEPICATVAGTLYSSIHRRAGLLCVHAIAITPAGLTELVRSSVSVDGGLPCVTVRSAPATTFSGPASVQSRYGLHAHRVAKRPLHRKRRQLRCLRCRFDCYRVERTSSRAGIAPAEVQRLSRRTITPAIVARMRVSVLKSKQALKCRKKSAPRTRVFVLAVSLGNGSGRTRAELD
jgi:hypothetical protein